MTMKTAVSQTRCSVPITMVFILGVVAVAANPAFKPLMDFSDPSVADRWISVNDDVMGGVSKGSFRITDDETLEFSGDISLENQGGFASIRTRPADLQLDPYDAMAIRIKGDGRTYFLNLRTAPTRAAGSYRASFRSEENLWQEVRIPLTRFYYSAFGRRIPGANPLRAGEIRSVGFTLADKQAGPFRLEIDWIRAEKIVSAREPKGPERPENGDIVDTAAAAGQFKTLLAAVDAAGLLEVLRGPGPLTVFAPSDDAFNKLPDGTVEELLRPENGDELRALLSYHIVPGKILLGGQSLATLHGQSLRIAPTGSFAVGTANVTMKDVMASNGVIHVIDKVLTPSIRAPASRSAARAVIELAIRRGVPLFNGGQPSACVAVYEVATASLLKSHPDVLSDNARSILRNALSSVERDRADPMAQAWTLRRALDVVYASLADD